MIWNYHDDDISAEIANIDLNITGVKKDIVQKHHYRVDQEFSNAFEAWKQMGRPQQPSKDQLEKLERASILQLYETPKWIKSNNNDIKLNFSLPRQAVSLIKLTW